MIDGNFLILLHPKSMYSFNIQHRAVALHVHNYTLWF